MSMLKDCLGHEINVDDLVCVPHQHYTFFGRVVRLTRCQFQFMSLHASELVLCHLKHSRPRKVIPGDILRCMAPERCMVVNSVDDVEHLFVDEAAVREVGFKRFDQGE